jgi:hypothetical protein
MKYENSGLLNILPLLRQFVNTALNILWFHKREGFLDHFSNYQLLNRGVLYSVNWYNILG